MTMATGLRYFLIGVLVLGALVATALMEGLGLSLLAAIVASVLIAVLIHAVIVGAGFLLAWRLSHRQGGAVPRGFLRAWPGEVVISLRNMYLDIPWRGGWRAVVPARSRGAILLVHGYGCNRGVWRGFFGWLGSLGYTVDAIDLSPPQASIDDFGKQVLAGARDLCHRASVDDVIIIAHSMGGLAARAALRHDPHAPIRHVITIATPHRGTYHARMGRGICATEMVPDGPWLTQLNAALPVHHPGLFSCVASRHDNIVSPLDQALLPGAHTFVCERVGHMRLMYHPAARSYIAARLDALAPASGGTASAG
ncbi:esterase/lipase family protein [Pigmentiphaga litoralis]|uniref:esterase/lipase family protein n=1 Tax=Pigmentiphaga litoralis TaxID=516702 RepID=UPI003B42A745